MTDEENRDAIEQGTLLMLGLLIAGLLVPVVGIAVITWLF